MLLTAAVVAGGAFAVKTYQDKQGSSAPSKPEPKKETKGWGKK